MAIEWSIEKPISAREALFRAGGIGLLGAGIGAVHLVTGWGLPCPFRAITGWLCPLCGGTHMVEAVLRGDVVSAWGSNPVALVFAVCVAVRAVGWVVEVVRNPRAVSLRWLPLSWHKHWFAAFVAVSVAYVLARNLLPLT